MAAHAVVAMSTVSRVTRLEAAQRARAGTDVRRLTDQQLAEELAWHMSHFEMHRHGRPSPYLPDDPAEFDALYARAMAPKTDADLKRTSDEELELHLAVLLSAAERRRSGLQALL